MVIMLQPSTAMKPEIITKDWSARTHPGNRWRVEIRVINAGGTDTGHFHTSGHRVRQSAVKFSSLPYRVVYRRLVHCLLIMFLPLSATN